MPDAPHNFAASQIAKALGLTPRLVRWHLRDCVATGVAIVRGNETRTWALDSIPVELRDALQRKASLGGYRDAAHFLSAPRERWQPALTVSEIAPSALVKAGKLREAMLPSLQRRNDTGLSAGELAALGLRDFQATFKREISTAHWRRLFDRTIERDRGFEEFDRLEIYLDDQPRRKATPVGNETPGLSGISRALAAIADMANPSPEQRRALWLAALEGFEMLLSAGQPDKSARETIFTELFERAPFLARSRDSLRKTFNVRREKWLTAETDAKALRDGRVAANQARGLDVPAEDVDVVVAHSVMVTGGRVSQAWRECLTNGWLSEDLLSRFNSTPARKSYVPAAVRKAVRHEVKMMNGVHSAPRKARDNGAYLNRYWDCIAAGAWYCADDCTLPIYIYVPDGNGWFTLMRGQFLLMIDTRSTCILGFALIPERGYNSRVIRSLVTRTADVFGLPSDGFYFERGIWRSSRILKGTDNEAALPWDKVEQGLREFGLRFQHAIRARSKPVERVLGAFQNYMEGLPGYAGRDERHDPQEAFQKMKLAVERKAVNPIGNFYSLAQWEEKLAELCKRYNAERREGKMTKGLAPEDAFHEFQDKANPRARFDASCRYLLAHHKRPVTVGTNGITLRFGKQEFNYRDEQTGRLRGQKLIAWFNPDFPDVLTVTDLQRSNAFCVERSQQVPALDAPDDLMAQEMSRIEKHMGYARTRYRILKSKYTERYRPNLADRETVELGRLITGETNRVKDDRKKDVRKMQTLRGRASRSGIPVEIMDTRREDAGTGANLFLEGIRELEEETE